MLALKTNFVIKNPQLEESQDYVLLRQKGIEHIEKLAHQIWTDYNIHDPGITILELLCYAISDLGYRTGFDIKDLLTEEENGLPFIDNTAFHTAKDIFPSHPVTFNDLRKILIDITGVKQAWIGKNENVYYYLDAKKKQLIYNQDDAKDIQCDPLNGLFNVLIQYEDFVIVEPMTVSVGKNAPIEPFALNSFVLPKAGSDRRGLKFEVSHPLKINHITLIGETSGSINLRLINVADNSVLEEINKTLGAKTPEKIELNWQINDTGIYKIDTGSTTIKLYRTPNANFPFEIEDVIKITQGVQGGSSTSSYYFFYDWEVEYWRLPNTNNNSSLNLIAEDVKEKVKNKLYQYRNLCEDFINIKALKTEEISVCMDLEVRPDVDLEETLAEIYYQLELYVSPPVNFYSIQELLDKGKTTDQIFEGPLLDHGFIDNDEFIGLNRSDCLRTSDIIQIIMDVEGVTAVKSISLLSFVQIEESEIQLGDTIHRETNENGEEEIFRIQQEDWTLKLQDINFFAPDFSPKRSKTFFYKSNLPYLANRKIVDDLLAEKRAQQIRSKLRGHQTDLTVPVGAFRDLEDYYPIQNDLPETYFTGQNLVSESRSNLRKAQSNQLKGYLLFFEQILANYLSQLGHIKHLFSWKKDAPSQSYFTQKVKEIANIEELYIDDYHTSLDFTLRDIIETDEIASERKNRFLDHLIGRFSEQLTEYALMMQSLLKDKAAERLIADKQALLNDYPKMSRERGKGFDYRFPDAYDNLTGFQRRVYRLLGIYDKQDCTVGRRNFASPRIRIISKIVIVDDQPKTWYFFRILTEAAAADVVEQESMGAVVDYTTYDFVFESSCCESRQQLCILIDALISFGANKVNWCKIDNNPFSAGPTWILKRTCVSCEDLLTWTNSGSDDLINDAKEEILGFTPPSIVTEEDLLEEVIGHFFTYANREGFHVIENILLRKRTVEGEEGFLPIEIHSEEEKCQCVEVKDPYSFRASVILPSWPVRFSSTRFRQLIEKTLRLEAPAHIYLRICWINHCEMQEFEKCHDAWLSAHADLDCKYRGERELPMLDPPDPEKDILTPEEKAILADYRIKLKDFIDKLYNLNNVFTVARIHGCDDVDSDEPQVSLNNTSLGSI